MILHDYCYYFIIIVIIVTVTVTLIITIIIIIIIIIFTRGIKDPSGFRKIAIRSKKFVWRVKPRLQGLSERCL